MDTAIPATSTWDKVMALKSKDKRNNGLTNNLTDEELECVLGTVDYFGGNIGMTYHDLSRNAKANVNGSIVPFAPCYRIFDWLGMCVMGDRISSTDATKVLVYSFLKVDGDIDKWITDLREVDYDMDESWKEIILR